MFVVTAAVASCHSNYIANVYSYFSPTDLLCSRLTNDVFFVRQAERSFRGPFLGPTSNQNVLVRLVQLHATCST